MKLKLKNLKRIIVEALSKVDPQLSVTGIKSTKEYPDAVLVSSKDRDRIIQSLKVSSRYKDKLQYVWKESTVGLSDKIYNIGDLTNGNGDPFTYKKISGNKYRVISGPIPKSIGKVYNLSPSPAVSVNLESEDQAEPNARQNSEPVSILSMELGKYAKKYLNPPEQNIFDSWNLLIGNRNKTLEQFFNNDKELIKNDIKRLNVIAKEVSAEIEKDKNAIRKFRAPGELLKFYAIDINDENQLNNSIEEVASYVGNNVLFSEALAREFEK